MVTNGNTLGPFPLDALLSGCFAIAINTKPKEFAKQIDRQTMTATTDSERQMSRVIVRCLTSDVMQEINKLR